MTAFISETVLVLGGNRRIGAAIVQRFAADGATVMFTYAGSHAAAEQLAAETGSTAVQTDSADRDAVIARVRDSGPLDVLVVNSGFAKVGRSAVQPAALAAKETWSMDFVSGALSDGRQLRALTGADAFTREALAIDIDQRIKGEQMVEAMARISSIRGVPRTIRVDNGRGIILKALDRWALREWRDAGLQLTGQAD